ncbi:MAG: hypothetical protein M9965_15410 [Anaerolineae bacterium]|nr:hypothetical protein [Anaerolineae bacterium]
MTDLSLPFVTIVMPVRNEGAYIKRSLDAVLAQDYPARTVGNTGRGRHVYRRHAGVYRGSCRC